MKNTGYDKLPDDAEDEKPVVFTLEYYPNQYQAVGITARLLRNGEPVGMVRFKNKNEMNWMTHRVNGEFDPAAFTPGISDPI